MEFNQQDCKTLSKTWREMGGKKLMPFKDFAELFNKYQGNWDSIFDEIEHQKSLARYAKPKPPIQNKDEIKNTPICKENEFGVVQWIALGVIVVGGIYLLTKKNQ